jgi:hypothetical protein
MEKKISATGIENKERLSAQGILKKMLVPGFEKE